LTMSEDFEVSATEAALNIVSMTNCTSRERPWAENRTIEITEKFSISIEKEITSSSIRNVDIGLNWGALKLGASFKEEDLTRLKQETNYEVTKKINEVIAINELVLPRTQLLFKATLKKGLLRAKISGNIIVNALITARLGGPVPGGLYDVWLSDSITFTQQPSDRTVPYEGYFIADTYSHYDKAVIESPLAEGDPRCVAANPANLADRSFRLL
jgi:hypothetical protein